MIEYFSRLYCESIAKACLVPLIYSGMLQKFVKFEEANSTRYRLNIMLQWEYGWFKSSILKQTASWFPFESNIVTTATGSALRGSFVDGKFYVPELLISDVLIFPEFTSIMKTDDETLGALLIALEEANVRVALVKGGKLQKSELIKIRNYGADFVDDRLVYRNEASIWTATHTVDNIPDMLRDALLSRFYICSVQPSQIPADCAWKDPAKIRDIDLENKFGNWIKEVYERKTKPDHDFADRVLDILRGTIGNERKRPREVGDIRRMIIAHHDIFPNQNERDVSVAILPYFNPYAGLTSREVIATYILNNPHTFQEILDFTGLKKANIMNHLRRLGALKHGTRPTKYYLNDIPSPVTTNSPTIIRVQNKE